MNILYLIVDKKSSAVVSERQKIAVIYDSDSNAVRACVSMIMSVSNYYQFAEDFELFRVGDVDDILSHKECKLTSLGTFEKFKNEYSLVLESFRNRLEGDDDEV